MRTDWIQQWTKGALGPAVLVAAWLSACTSGSVTPPPPEAPEDPGEPAAPELTWNGITPVAPPTPPPPLHASTPEVLFEPPSARGLTEVTEVTVRLRVSGLPGRGTVDAEFLAPGPSVHDRRSEQLVAEPTEERELRFRLPVAGTNIPALRLSGPWEVRFFLDGAPLTSTTFTLEH